MPRRGISYIYPRQDQGSLHLEDICLLNHRADDQNSDDPDIVVLVGELLMIPLANILASDSKVKSMYES
jgi:hypothetical protein